MTNENLNKIDEIKKIINEYGGFSIGEVEYTDGSPTLETKGKFIHVGEYFSENTVTINVYDPKMENEIDSYEVDYSDFDSENLDIILDLSNLWFNLNK